MRRVKGKSTKSELEEIFALQMRPHGLHLVFMREVQFHPTRKWRLDYGDRITKIGIELDGGTWGGASGHNTGRGIARDMEKSNEAQRLGWKIFRFDVKMVKSGEAINYILKVLKENSNRCAEGSAVGEST